MLLEAETLLLPAYETMMAELGEANAETPSMLLGTGPSERRPRWQ